MADSIMPSPLVERLLAEKKRAFDFQSRRHEEWDDNAELYRNKTKTNRLTQRQSVAIPLMKETIKTLGSKIDDPPSIEWQEKAGDLAKSMILQAVWDDDYRRLNLEGVDAQDKTTVLLYGRGFKKLNWADGELAVYPLDVYDVTIDPLVNPLFLETARFIIHQNIMRPLREILEDGRYSAEGKRRLKQYLDSKSTIIQSDENRKTWEARLERLRDVGVETPNAALFAAGDTIVNLTEHYTNTWENGRFVRRVIVYAENTVELLNEPLKNLLGVDFWPFVTWGEDTLSNDFWSDGPADLVRNPNKVLNVWFSQLVENRTIRNFQMHWYDATVQGYTPQTYEPGPGRMLPAPGDPSKTIMPVNIQGLDETLQAIDFVIRLVERGTAATAIEKGVAEKKQITLGEVQTLVSRAAERTIAMQKFYRRSWEELAMKWLALTEVNGGASSRTLTKMGRDGRLWPKTIVPADWKSAKGFLPLVRSTSEQEAEQAKTIQKFTLLLTQFPNNPVLKRIAQKRMLEVLDLTPEEMRQVEEAQRQQDEIAQQVEQLPLQQAQTGLPVKGLQRATTAVKVRNLKRRVGGLQALPPGLPPVGGTNAVG